MKDQDELGRRQHLPLPPKPVREATRGVADEPEKLDIAICCFDGKVAIDLGEHGGIAITPPDAIRLAILILECAHSLL